MRRWGPAKEVTQEDPQPQMVNNPELPVRAVVEAAPPPPQEVQVEAVQPTLPPEWVSSPKIDVRPSSPGVSLAVAGPSLLDRMAPSPLGGSLHSRISGWL